MELTAEQQQNRDEFIAGQAEMMMNMQKQFETDKAEYIDSLGIAPAPEDELPFPDELNHPPGLTGEMVKQIRAISYRDSPVLALGAALAGLAHFSGNNYLVTPWEAPLTPYFVIIAPTGEGKERPRSFLRNCAAKLTYSGITREAMASGPALLREMGEYNQMLFMPDEVGFLLQQKKDSGHISALVADITMMFGKGIEGSYSGKGFANKNDRIDPISNPALTIMGTTTLETFMDSLTSKDVNSGFLNRITILSVTGKVAPKKLPSRPDDTHIIERLQAIVDAGSYGTNVIAQNEDSAETITVGGKEFLPIAADTEAEKLLQDFDTKHDEMRTGEHGNIHVRAGQQAFTIAGILALGDCDDVNRPVIRESHAEYAIKFITWSVNKWMRHLQDDMHEGDKFGADVGKVLGWIKDARNLAGLKDAIPELCKQGMMTRTLLMRKSHFKSGYLTDILTTLVGSGEIQEKVITGEDGKKTHLYYARK